MSYMEIGRQEGAQILTGGGDSANLSGDLSGGYYVQPTLMAARTTCAFFQEEIGPTLGVTSFRDEAEALAIANDTDYGLGAGVWTRDMNRAYRMGRGAFRRVACGPTATTPILRTRPLADTRSRVLAVKPTR